MRGFARGVFELAFPAEDCAVRKNRAAGFYPPVGRSTCATEMPRTMYQPHTHTRPVRRSDSFSFPPPRPPAVAGHSVATAERDQDTAQRG